MAYRMSEFTRIMPPGLSYDAIQKKIKKEMIPKGEQRTSIHFMMLSLSAWNLATALPMLIVERCESTSLPLFKSSVKLRWSSEDMVTSKRISHLSVV